MPVHRLGSFKHTTGYDNLCTDDSRDVYCELLLLKNSLIVHFSIFLIFYFYFCYTFSTLLLSCLQSTNKSFWNFLALHFRLLTDSPQNFVHNAFNRVKGNARTNNCFNCDEFFVWDTTTGAHFWLHDCANLFCHSSKQANINRRRTPFLVEMVY